MKKKLVDRFVKPLVEFYLRKDRYYKLDGKNWLILKGVFHPSFFVSTNHLKKFVAQLDLKGKSFLELGAGSGVVSYQAWKKGAAVTSSDISKVAVRGLEINCERHDVQFNVVESDLFDKLDEIYDVIIINPPYFPKDPETESQHAWYCGRNFEYFHKCFGQLQKEQSKAEVYMILSDGCEIDKIGEVAKQAGMEMTQRQKLDHWFEENYLFKVEVTKGN